MIPTAMLGKLGDFWEVTFFGSFRGSGLGVTTKAKKVGIPAFSSPKM